MLLLRRVWYANLYIGDQHFNVRKRVNEGIWLTKGWSLRLISKQIMWALPDCLSVRICGVRHRSQYTSHVEVGPERTLASYVQLKLPLQPIGLTQSYVAVPNRTYQKANNQAVLAAMFRTRAA